MLSQETGLLTISFLLCQSLQPFFLPTTNQKLPELESVCTLWVCNTGPDQLEATHTARLLCHARFDQTPCKIIINMLIRQRFVTNILPWHVSMRTYLCFLTEVTLR
jgi:hypothetical protein